MIINENEGTIFYSNKPTNPNKITPKTPLDDLNLNWSEKDLPEKKRTKHVHRLHPYLGKFIPQLVEVFLRKYFKTGQTVLDPFCGSGTTLVQANELGINSVGYDVSAFNVLLCKTKTDAYNLHQVRKEVLDVLEKVSVITSDSEGQQSLLEPKSGDLPIFETDNEYLKKWFAPRSLQELLAYRYFIEKGKYRYKDLLKIILSRSARSARLTTHFDLDFPKKPQTEPYWCYKHSKICRPVESAFKFLKRYSIDTLRRIKEFAAVRTDAKVEVYHGDCRKVDFPSVDGVITSPPYVGLIDYHEQHAYGYHLLGLEDNREKEIGPASKGTSQRAQREYQKDIIGVFKRAIISLPSGGRLIVVAGDRNNLYDEIADLIGAEVEAVIQRHVNRRTGRRSGRFFESVFIWRKKQICA
ncbi:MAG: site-specific DNA-methyltransferase [Firmicutes bacterium]|nr:site-specific DNA-methyltransferase [Bacillota bacterium]